MRVANIFSLLKFLERYSANKNNVTVAGKSIEQQTMSGIDSLEAQPETPTILDDTVDDGVVKDAETEAVATETNESSATALDTVTSLHETKVDTNERENTASTKNC